MFLGERLEWFLSQELMEAAHSVVSVTEAGENIRDSAAIGLSVAGSLATVISRHIITAASQNRATQFIVSLPLPMQWNRGSLGSGWVGILSGDNLILNCKFYIPVKILE